MADVGFFDPTGTLAASFGEVQTSSPSETSTRAQGLKSDGDEAASHYHDHRITLAETYKAFASSGNLTVPKLGTITSGYHVDTWTITWSNTDWPSLSINGHKHSSSTAHPSCRIYDHGMTLASGWGIPRTVCGISLGSGDDAIGIASATLSFSVTHQDELDESGEFLAAENRDGVLTLSVTFTGVPGALTGPSGWDDNQDPATSKGNTQADTYTRSWQKHIAHETTSAA